MSSSASGERRFDGHLGWAEVAHHARRSHHTAVERDFVARTGLVLGAGGIVGQAYQAGVLAAVEQEVGWDPRSADIIVGSSAGSVMGSALRLGVAASDMAASLTGGEMSPSGTAFFDALDGADAELPSPTAADLLRRWRFPSRALVARAMRRPWALRPTAVASTLLPAGRYDLRERTAVLDPLADGWPPGLWICTVRRDHGRRVVFGRPGSPTALLSEAVAASCAIPGYFAPVRIGTREYVDGGVHSPTNADVLAHAHLDTVVVVSSMSAAHGRSGHADAPVRWAMHRRLEQEVRRLRSRGTEVIRFEPSPSTVDAMGLNAIADDRSGAVADVAYADAAAHAASPRTAFRFAPLLRPTGRARAA
jgi:NTE family protein